MSYKLFLDDERLPSVAYWINNSVQSMGNNIYLENEWVIVRNYNEFVEHITKNGLPYLISFDHDLADEHYIKPIVNGIIPYSEYAEKTGADCARWFCYYFLDNHRNEKFPQILIHSMNNYGSMNIASIFKTFKKVYSII